MSLPADVTKAVKDSIDLLGASLSCKAQTTSTHELIVVRGWDKNSKTKNATATYLVGLRAFAVDAALKIRARLADTKDDQLELVKNVEAIVGSATTPLSDNAIITERNPWIAEGLWHLCLLLARKQSAFHPHGDIVALDAAHVATKDHGLDVCAIYDEGGHLGLSVVETKAYEKYPDKAISQATKFFKEIESGKHDLRMRQAVNTMRPALAPAKQKQIATSFWKQRRTFLPNPHCDISCKCDWTQKRTAFSKLAIPKNRIIVMPNDVKQFRAFFDDIASRMRKVANKF